MTTQMKMFFNEFFPQQIQKPNSMSNKFGEKF